MLNDTLIKDNIVHAEHAHHDMSKTTIFGFWIYLMSDCILFACLFATYAVLVNATAGGPSGRDIFNLKFILVDTLLLLISAITYGMGMVNMKAGKLGIMNIWLFLTFLLGLGFIVMEFYEFHDLIIEGFSPKRSAFLSSFFALISTHAIHVSVGLIWIAIMIIQTIKCGLTSINKTRLICLSLFWHFLDVIWICVFTVVYLLGMIS